MSISERKRLEQIDRKIGRLHGQFQDITREMTRLYEAELDAEELARKILDLIKDTEQKSERIEQDYALGDIDGRIAQGVINYVMLKANIKELCQEQLQKEGK